MTQPDWKLIVTKAPVRSTPQGLWTMVLDYVAGPRKLKIVAVPSAKWTLRAQLDSGPDGERDSVLAAEEVMLFPAVLRGALIGKVGGSAADNTTPKVTGGTEVAASGIQQAFPVGSFCVIELNATQKGPLFLTMNDTVRNFSNHSGELQVDIYEAL